jgi:predicted Zn-dependent protease
MGIAAPRAYGTAEEVLRHGAQLLKTDPAAAAAQAREVVRADPANADAFRLMGRALRALGDDAAAEQAEVDAVHASVHDSELLRAGQALAANELAVAERILRPRLKDKPTDVAAIRMMAELAARIGRLPDAENLLRRALELAPAFTAARLNLALVLQKQHRPTEAIELVDALLERERDNPAAQSLKAAALGHTGGYEEAASLYEELLARFPAQPKLWMSYGHVLKTVGRQEEGIRAYRRATEIAPSLGEAWWSLANLKTVRLGEEDIAAMEEALAKEGLEQEDRFHLHFALGKAYEDARRAEDSFHHYAEGNRLRRAEISYDPDEVAAYVKRAPSLFTRSFFEEREGVGCPAPDAIFILGMPRAGSTLIEQILASHPEVEGTMELPDIGAIAKRIGAERQRYLEALTRMDAGELEALGREYLDRTRVQRKTGRAYFIDKMPNNWMHSPLIHLILPNAKIIDARRHPLACCFSNFKQHFARGQGFTYDLTELGNYYAAYVGVMRHIDEVLPGRVHRVFHEAVLDDPEGEVRRLLDYLGLPFDEACLRFYENDRAVRTASSEQVRRPINRDGVDRWQPFEPWLGPLKDALGPVLTCYPEVPV